MHVDKTFFLFFSSQLANNLKNFFLSIDKQTDNAYGVYTLYVDQELFQQSSITTIDGNGHANTIKQQPYTDTVGNQDQQEFHQEHQRPEESRSETPDRAAEKPIGSHRGTACKLIR